MTLAPTKSSSETEITGPKSGFWITFLIAFVVAQAVGGLGAITTVLGPWYMALNKPWWQPPDYLFGPAWSVIFTLAALSAVFAWRNAPSKASRRNIVLFFMANAFFNVLWSALFFRFQRPDWALMEVGVLWASVLVPIIVFSQYSKKAAWLLVPYIAWVTFAGILNWKIVQLN